MTKDRLRFLTDENISPRVVDYLRGNGVDVLDVKENGWFGSTDEELIKRALIEKRLIVTHDSDFGKLTFGQGLPCYGIVYLRPKNFKPHNVIKTLERLFSSRVEIKKGVIIVVEDTRARVRSLL